MRQKRYLPRMGRGLPQPGSMTPRKAGWVPDRGRGVLA